MISAHKQTLWYAKHVGKGTRTARWVTFQGLPIFHSLLYHPSMLAYKKTNQTRLVALSNFMLKLSKICDNGHVYTWTSPVPALNLNTPLETKPFANGMQTNVEITVWKSADGNVRELLLLPAYLAMVLAGPSQYTQLQWSLVDLFSMLTPVAALPVWGCCCDSERNTREESTWTTRGPSTRNKSALQNGLQ